MKTINVQKTEKFRKTILKSFAVVISLVLISFTVSAQDLWKSLLSSDTFTEIAYALVETNNDFDAGESTMIALYDAVETENEGVLELEDWMTKEETSTSAFFIAEEAEESMELEDWMTRENRAELEMMILETETEIPMGLENWMLDENSTPVQFENANEEPMKLESWMLS